MLSPEPSEPSTPDSKPAIPRRRSELTRQLLEVQIGGDVAALQRAIKTGAHWFYWVAALSLINSIVALSGGHLVFLAGLAVSQIADAFAAHLGFFGVYFSMTIDLVVAVFVCGFGYLAAHGSRAALIAGMILYALDGAVFLLLSAYAPAAFHAFVLYQIWQGWNARTKLDRLRTESATLAGAEADGRTLESLPFR